MWIRNNFIGKRRLNSGSDLSNRRWNGWCLFCKWICQLNDRLVWYNEIRSVFGLGDDYPVANNRLKSPIIVNGNSSFSQIVNWHFIPRLLLYICQSDLPWIDTIPGPTDQISSLWPGFRNSCNIRPISEPIRAYPFKIKSKSHNRILRLQKVVLVICINRRLFILRHQQILHFLKLFMRP
jgi:hypothetical protein